MVSKLSGDERFFSLQAFGSSMLPLIKSGDKLRLELVAENDLGEGDVIVFSRSTKTLIAHRIIKIFTKKKSVAFLVKGDNRLRFDTIVFSRQIIGRVMMAGNMNIRTWGWKTFGRLIAWGSYRQFLIWRGLRNTSVNLFRHQLEEKGILPKASFLSPVNAFCNPLMWLKQLAALAVKISFLILRQRLLFKDVKILRVSQPNTSEMTQMWNDVFPKNNIKEMDFKETLTQEFALRAPVFFEVRQKGILLGWALVRLAANSHIDALAIQSEASKYGVDQVLIGDIVRQLKIFKVKNLSLNTQPLTLFEGGAMPPLVSTICIFGFLPDGDIEEWGVGDNEWIPLPTQELKNDVKIHLFEPDHLSEVVGFLKRNQIAEVAEMFLEKRECMSALPSRGILVAVFKAQVIGMCRFMTHEMMDGAEMSWMWSVHKNQVRWGYLSWLYVDRKYRRQGIGTALAQEAFRRLWFVQCRYIALILRRKNSEIDKFYSRFGFNVKSCFSRWRCEVS